VIAKYLLHENQTVFLKEKGMKIGFGAIGKGYTAETVKEFLKKKGVIAGLVGAGGDVTIWGKHPQLDNWKIAIANPNHNNIPISNLKLKETSVVTSGDYEKYAIIDGKRYSHIINPITGYPAEGLKSVTIICNNAELADALATAVSVMGEEEGLKLINKLKGVEGLFVNYKDELLTTTNIKMNYE
jgi:thiamine biosynthesis lipoprotein